MSYALGFGVKSKFNQKTLEIFEEFGAKSEGKLFNKKEPRPYFTMIQDYNTIVQDLDQSFIWGKALTQEETRMQQIS